MKIEDIVKLTNAGWSKDEILSLVNAKEADPVQQPDPVPEQQPAAQPEQPVEQQKPDDDRLNKIETSLDYVINRLNYMAVQQSHQPEQKTESVDDILASVVRGVKPDK